MKLNLAALAFLALTGCAGQQTVVRDQTKKTEDESLVAKYSFDLKDKTGRCALGLYVGSDGDTTTSLLKTEYCKRGMLEIYTHYRWINLNGDGRFDRLCWLNQFTYKKAFLIDYPEVCFDANVSVEELLFIEKGKYLHFYDFSKPKQR